MEFILEISNLTKRYSDFILDDINLKIKAGKIVGLIGENGAGKTTLISLILNQVKRDYGNILIFGKDNILDEISIKQEIGFLVDECCFHSCLNLNDVAKIMQSIYKNWNNHVFHKLLEKLELSKYKKIADMSKGMKNKLMLAVALSHIPSFLILDELTSGLDPVIRDDILIILKEYAKKQNTTIFFSTHITSDLERIADEIAFLHNGHLIFYESLKELQSKYRILKCSDIEYQNLDHSFIIKESHFEKEYTLLIDNKKDNKVFRNSNVPNIDEIMLLFIKGE